MTVMPRYPYALLLPAIALIASGCTSNPIGPVSDFDFVFDEIQEVKLSGEVDTSAVAIEYEPAKEDTTYLITLRSFLEDARSAPQSGDVPESVVRVSEAAHAVLTGAVRDVLEEMAAESDAGLAAFIARVDLEMVDPSSETALFTHTMMDAFAEQQALVDLLGLEPSTSASQSSLFRSAPGGGSLTDGPPAAALSIYGTNSCVEDARIQTQDQLAALDEERRRREEALARALQANLAAADTFVVRQSRKLDAERTARAAKAQSYFVNVDDAVASLVQNKLITQGTAANLRLINVSIILTRAYRSMLLHAASLHAVEVAAAAARDVARQKYDSQTAALGVSYSQAAGQLSNLESEAVKQCHDQGGSTG